MTAVIFGVILFEYLILLRNIFARSFCQKNLINNFFSGSDESFVTEKSIYLHKSFAFRHGITCPTIIKLLEDIVKFRYPL